VVRVSATQAMLRAASGYGEGSSHAAAPGDVMFLFFNNRLGCLGSLALSVVHTVLLILLLNR
jgi:hypothetical protein